MHETLSVLMLSVWLWLWPCLSNQRLQFQWKKKRFMYIWPLCVAAPAASPKCGKMTDKTQKTLSRYLQVCELTQAHQSGPANTTLVLIKLMTTSFFSQNVLYNWFSLWCNIAVVTKVKYFSVLYRLATSAETSPEIQLNIHVTHSHFRKGNSFFS